MKTIYKFLTILLVILTLLPLLFSCGGGEHVCSYDIIDTVCELNCESSGVVVKYCECGKSVSEFVETVGHSYGEWKIISESSCDRNGIKESVCTRCGAIQRSVAEKTSHDYLTSEEYVDGTAYIRYTCQVCSESFSLDADTELCEEGESYVANRPENFSFNVICEGDETYIRENLKIVDAYFESSETNLGTVEYTLTYLENNIWQVSPKTKYTPGSTYVASRRGGVVFKDYGFSDLAFSIEKERTESVSLNNDIIFISELDRVYGGYLPYSLEYSDGEGEMFLTLGKADHINEGDIICVGPATNVNEFINSDAEHIFGRVVSKIKLESGKILLLLKEPTTSEVFSSLDIYSEYIKEVSGFVLADDIEEQLTAALLGDEDFAKLAAATYDAAHEYASSRGLTASCGTFADFIKSIKIDEKTYEPPTLSYVGDAARITSKIAIIGEASIPVALSGQKLGSIKLNFRAYININGITVLMNMEGGKFSWSGYDNGLEFFFGMTDDITVGFTFDVITTIDYSAETKPYILNTESGTYHFKDCRHVGMIKDESKKQAVTTQQLFELIQSGSAKNECQSCLPILAMKASMYVLNTKTKFYHTATCPNGRLIISENIMFTDRTSDQLLEDGYYACGTCNPDQIHVNAFDEKLLDKIAYGDFGEHMKELEEITRSIKNEDKKIILGYYPLSFTGFDREDLTLSVYIDFHLEATLHYEYEIHHSGLIAYRGTKDGVRSFEQTFDESVTKNSLTMVGKARLDVGLQFDLDIYLKGFKRSINGNITCKMGLYAKLHGALNLDFTDKTGDYAAAYFEAGIHMDAHGSLTLPIIGTKNAQFINGDIPLKKLGYETVYYGYASLPDTIVFDAPYIDLNRLGLAHVKYFDLVKMTSGETNIEVFAPSEHYTIEVSLSSDRYCYIKGGYLFVSKNAPAFSTTIKVKFTGTDTWSDYRKGNCKVVLMEYNIPVSYDGVWGEDWTAEDPTVSFFDVLEYEISADRSYYIVSDVGDYVPGMTITIPETHNGLPVKGIKRHAFEFVFDVNLIFPKTIEFVGYDAFGTCRINALYIEDIAAWCNIDFENFAANPLRLDDCTPIVNGQILTDLVIPYGVTEVKYMAFYGCKKLKSVSFSDTVKVIGSHSFYKCDNIESIKLGAGLEKIDTAAFAYIDDVTKITFPKRLKSIGDHAFDSCTSLGDFTLPQKLEYIGDAAFYKTKITEMVIPDSVTYLGSGAFLHCHELRRVVVGNGVTAILAETFQYCYRLIEVDLGDSITVIGSYAFHQCDNLVKITLPKSLEALVINSFLGCYSIVEIENLSDIDIRAGYAEPGYVALRALHVYGEGEKSNIYTTKDGFVFYADDERCLLINYIGDEKDVVLPSSFNGRAYDIHNYAFAYTKAESITIPACVKAIGYRCFYNASELKKVIFEDTEGWTRSYDFDKGSIEYISADVMSNSTEVVKCVTNSAAEYYWRKI